MNGHVPWDPEFYVLSLQQSINLPICRNNLHTVKSTTLASGTISCHSIGCSLGAEKVELAHAVELDVFVSLGTLTHHSITLSEFIFYCGIKPPRPEQPMCL